MRDPQLCDLLLEHSPDIMLIIRCDDGRVIDASRAASAAYHYQPEELRSLTIQNLRAADAPHPALQRCSGERMARHSPLSAHPIPSSSI